MISDQLANVGSPAPNHRLVLQLINGINDQYEGIAMMIQQSDPLPDFYEARSKLILEETRKENQTQSAPNPSDTALHVATGDNSSQQPQQATYFQNRMPSQPRPQSTRNTTQPTRGRAHGHGRFQTSTGWQSSYRAQPWNSQQQSPYQQWPAPYSQWTQPPFPYPTTGSTVEPWQQANPTPGPGILGSRPPQAYSAYPMGQTPTDLDQAFQTMTLTPPDQNWYVDSRATSHMTHSRGNFSSYSNNGLLSNIIVGNGSTIPVVGNGTQTLSPPLPPFKLSNVLHAPNLIKNLLSVRRSTFNY